MHLAAENDHSKCVQMFLQHRSDLASAANLSGWTCAHIAASKGSIAVIEGLLKSSAVGRRSVISDINKVLLT